MHTDLLALKLPDENPAGFSGLSSSVRWNSSFLRFLATAMLRAAFKEAAI